MRRRVITMAVREIKFINLSFVLAMLLVLPSLNFASSTLKPPKIKAEGFILIDFSSGQVLAEKNADLRMEPASLTKMMSSYVIAQEMERGMLHAEDKVKISEKAWRMKGSRTFLEVGSKVTVEALIKGMIVQSGNDATIALAEQVARSEEGFVALMNEAAERIGMKDTHFENATGMPTGDHYSTPRDMAVLGNALISDFPEHYKLYSLKSFKYNKINQDNRNKLLWSNKDVDGIKTGYTKSAGYCLVASALQDEMRLTSVVLGTKSKKARARESQKLLTYGFRFFETHRLYSAYEPLTKVRIWKGASEQLQIGLSQDLFITIPKGEYKNLDARMSINAEIVAPTQRGQKLGVVNIKLGKTEYANRELISLTDVASGSFWQSLLDSIRMSLK